MGTSSGFLGVLNNTVAACGGGVIAYGAIMGACLVGGIFEGILGAFLKPLRKFFPAIVTGSVVIAIGLSLLGVGINYFCGGTGKNDYGSLPNLFIGMVVLIVIVLLKHFAPSRSIFSSSAILFGILAGYVVAIIMTLTMSHTGVTADGVKYTYSWVVNFDEVKNAAWSCQMWEFPSMPMQSSQSVSCLSLLQSRQLAISQPVWRAEWTERLQIQSFQAVLSVMVLVHHLQRFSEYCQIPHSHRM